MSMVSSLMRKSLSACQSTRYVSETSITSDAHYAEIVRSHLRSGVDGIICNPTPTIALIALLECLVFAFWKQYLDRNMKRSNESISDCLQRASKILACHLGMRFQVKSHPSLS